MRCAWDALIQLLPHRMRQQVDRLGKNTLQELRLRLGLPPELICSDGCVELEGNVTQEELAFVVNGASRYSPWAAATSARGYITAQGGHRVGLCGQAVISAGKMSGVRELGSLCIRVARDFPGIGRDMDITGSLLIVGKPGSGKTTLLRDLIRHCSNRGPGSVAVVDERAEIFPCWKELPCFSTGKRTDILRGCGKVQGIEAVLRCMSPDVIAVDEITAPEDCEALLNAAWCGVRLFATAHAGSVKDLTSRPVYAPLISAGIFDRVVVLRGNRTWAVERMGV